MQYSILVVDDDPHFNKMISRFLERNGYAVDSVLSSKSALESIKNNTPDLLLTDFKLPDLNGLELMEMIKAKNPDQTMILMTNYSDIRTAVRSIQLGAFEFVTKPVNPDELLLTIQAALSQKQIAEASVIDARKRSDQRIANTYMVGKTESSKRIWEHIQLVAPTNMSVMILGESGTGKEYAARMIHDCSKRKDRPFIAVDCGALSMELAASELFGHVKGAFTGALRDKKGQFELANGGTLFMDEVGNLSYDTQVQLLRALQERKIRRVGSEADITVDVRIIAATNEQLTSAVGNNQFRLDLFHRLNEFELELIPLRDRLEDLDEYLHLFLDQANADLGKEVIGFADEVMEIFKNYKWPGNIRELRNIVRRSVLLTQENYVGKSQIPEVVIHGEQANTNHNNGFGQPIEKRSSSDLKQLQELQEKETIERVLLETKYNKSKAAAILNIDRTTLYNKIAKYNIEA